MRPGFRREWIDEAVRPLEPLVPAERLRQLKLALGAILGPEALIALKDVMGADLEEALETCAGWPGRSPPRRSIRSEAKPVRAPCRIPEALPENLTRSSRQPMTPGSKQRITVGELAVRFLVEAADSNGSATVLEYYVPTRNCPRLTVTTASRRRSTGSRARPAGRSTARPRRSE